MNKLILDEDIAQNLAEARKVYGNKNQILVSIEELNELACVLAKYPRYDSEAEATHELYNKVLDEYADVMVILNHVQHIFNLSDEDIHKRVCAKTDRLKRWLKHSDSMEETVKDRKVESTHKNDELCQGCVLRDAVDLKTYIDRCMLCYQAQATEGKAICYTPKFKKE